MKRFAFAVCLMLLATAAQAQNSWDTPGKGRAPGAVQMCLDSSGAAVPMTSGNCAGSVPVTGAFGGLQATTPTFSSSTISVTNTWQSLLTTNASRRSCDMQNQGTHVMFFQITATNVAPTGTASAKQVQPGQVIVCNDYIGDVMQGYVWITGTSTDAYQVTEYQ